VPTSDEEQEAVREATRQRFEEILENPEGASSEELGKNTSPLFTLGCSIVFAIPFVFAGTIMLLLFTVSPVAQWLEADSWPAEDCTIVHSGSRMEYTYLWEGETLTSNQYDFATFFRFTSERDSQRYTDGQITRCFVNPSDPGVSILSKSFNLEYLSGLVGVPLILVGLLFAYVFGKDATREMIYPSSLERPTDI